MLFGIGRQDTVLTPELKSLGRRAIDFPWQLHVLKRFSLIFSPDCITRWQLEVSTFRGRCGRGLGWGEGRSRVLVRRWTPTTSCEGAINGVKARL